MAIVVETGQSGADSETFASVSYADLHHSNRGNTAWALLTTGAKESALRLSADYIEQAYRMRWTGYRKTDTQALSWPRYEVPRPDTAANARYGYGVGFYENDSVPAEVQRACAELALRASSESLLADQEALVQTESVGPISTTYFQGVSRTKKYPAVDKLLAPLLSCGDLKLVRA